MSATSESPKTANVSWNKPEINYKIQHYEIFYNIKGGGDQKQTANHIIQVDRSVKRIVTII